MRGSVAGINIIAMLAIAACASAPKAQQVPPRLLGDRAMPRYPAELDAVGVGGSVRVRYTIDTAGRPVPPYEILESAHEVLANAVRSALPRTRFSPGRFAGRPVPVIHEEVFEFIADRKELSPLPIIVLRRDSAPDGVPRTVIGRALRDSAAERSVPWAERHAAQRAALSVILTDARRARWIRRRLHPALRSRSQSRCRAGPRGGARDARVSRAALP